MPTLNSTDLFTPNELSLIRSSWKIVSADGYGILANRIMIKILNNQEVKPMFKFASNLNTSEEITNSRRARAHGEKIFEAVALVIEHITDEEYCQTLLKQLGAAHSKFNLKQEYFEIVGMALIETLKDGLADSSTLDIEKVWIKTYNYVTNQMKIGMNEANQS